MRAVAEHREANLRSPVDGRPPKASGFRSISLSVHALFGGGL